MKKIIFIILPVLFLTGCGNSQTEKELIDFTGAAESDVIKYFSNTSVLADIMDGVKQNPKQAELTTKFQSGIRENYEWFMEYMKSVPEGESMPYHPKIGMTKEEYDELQTLIDDIQVVSTGKEKIKITQNDTLITFQGTGKLEVYNKVQIDLKNNVIKFKNYILPFEKNVIVDDADNGFKSKWKGYNWEYVFPNDIDNVDFTDLENLQIIQVKFTVGQMEKDGRIYMQVKERVIENGVKIEDSQIPILF